MEEGDYFLCTFGEGDGGGEIGGKTFDFGVVENHAMGLIAEQACPPLRVERGDCIRGDVDNTGFCAGGSSESFKNLVPGEKLIGGYMENLSDGAAIAQ